MKNLFLLILFFGIFFGAQFVYFENRLSDQKEINFDDVSASIVTIESINNRGKSFGSGVIISDDGYIITAFHVLSGNLSTVKISGKSYLANLIGFDEYADLAVLKINEQDLKHIEFSDEEELKIGQTVYAIGNPYNLGTSVSRGILSATGRNFGNPYLDIIQTDAAINKGNSGGALINSNGELIGLSTLIASASGGSDGVGFALPSEKVLSITNEIIKYGKVNRALLTFPYLMISLVMDKTFSDGSAKPTPSEPPEADAISVLNPISSPLLLIKAPPEFPLFIAASVWMMSR